MPKSAGCGAVGRRLVLADVVEMIRDGRVRDTTTVSASSVAKLAGHPMIDP
jgi:hypothetical protein